MASNIVTISGLSIFVISAIDVIHAIAIPTTGLKLDAIPGRISTTKFDCDLSGLYSGQCSELCGALHGFMPVQLLVFDSFTT
jgi:cytochrome c oxidase subunit 2